MTVEPRFHQMIYDARPWYHDFSSLGIQTHFREQTQERTIRGFLSDYSPRYLVDKFFSKPRHYLKKAYAAALRREKLMKTINVNGGNQQRKEKYILPYLEEAFLSCKSKGVEKPSTLELFCADGYYSFWMQRTYELQNLKALDLNERRIKQAKVMNSVLQSDIEFQYMDVYDLSPEERYDVTLCAGGLYHVHDPKRVLELCHTITRHYVVVQSVISLESEDEDYFVTPAPGWKHGSRFSNARLRKWIEEVGFEILEQGRDRLDNDAPLSSRGTAYYLCKKVE
ncbi:MAG: class I SAM-dependent methyltransferase [Myxococcota bacterium]|nr:class I SAM-dependent methyltransferase [Myxococcota bacterium]